MGDMLKEFVKSTMKNEIKENYPHIRYPAWMYARVTECRKESDIFVVTLQILDKNQQKDELSADAIYPTDSGGIE